MDGFTRIILKSGKENSLKRLHPWVFSGAIKSISGNPTEGDLVEVYSNKDEYLATGHFQPGSIAVKVLTFRRTEIKNEFWKERINLAWNLRKETGLADNPETNAFRLVCGEGDFLPGLIIDYYNGTAVLQSHSVGMYNQRMIISEVLKEVLGDRLNCIYDKSAASLPFLKGINSAGEYLYGQSQIKLIKEYGNIFQVDWEGGQKTGFYLDQRENRKLVEYCSKDRRVLNMFSYTGGFSVYALRGGAKLVHSVDASKSAVELADINVSLNFPGDVRHHAYVRDAFKFFESPESIYDLIILDPPAFAKHQDAINNALQGYKKLNKRAIELISPGGIIFTFSCSQAISRENFRKSVFVAAAGTGRNVRILQELSHPADHPVSIYHPEGEYLKGLVLMVE
jgi:23S rRNA (cytosine1962-C5)-methyltransferase